MTARLIDGTDLTPQLAKNPKLLIKGYSTAVFVRNHNIPQPDAYTRLQGLSYVFYNEVDGSPVNLLPAYDDQNDYECQMAEWMNTHPGTISAGMAPLFLPPDPENGWSCAVCKSDSLAIYYMWPEIINQLPTIVPPTDVELSSEIDQSLFVASNIIPEDIKSIEERHKDLLMTTPTGGSPVDIDVKPVKK